MNREILFRGKLEYNGKWIYGDLLQYENGDIAIFGDKLSSFGCECTEMSKRDRVNPDTVGQYTGLKDKDGRKIFEGDILDYTLFDAFGEDHQYKGVVKWIDDCFICDNSDGFNGLAWAVNQSLELEVIGNVTDNPELIK